MTIVLMVLKTIGCILLAVLLLLVLLILLLLFVPIRYRISAKLEDESQIMGRLSWLLHLVTLKGVYEDGKFHLTLRILFFHRQLMDTEQAKEAAEEGEDKAEESLKEAAEEITDDSKLWEMPEDETEQDPLEQEQDSPEQEPSAQQHDSEEKSSDAKQKPKRHRKKGVPVFIQLAQDFAHRIQELRKDAQNAIDKIKSISDDAGCRSALAHLKEELFVLLKMLCPRKLRMNIQFSAGSPDKTGEILGICAMFPVTYSKGNVLVPDFETEKAYAKGYADLKGRVYLYQIVGIAIRVIFDKNCKRLLHRIQALRSR